MMSRATPPSPSSPSDPNRRPTGGPGTSGAKPGIPGSGANRPNTTTPKAPEMGAGAPPSAGGQQANKVPTKAAGAAPGAPGASGGGGGAGDVASAAPGMPPIDQLQGRPIGRVLTKMGKVNREQVVEALDFQKRKGGALGRILIDLGYIKESDLNVALAAQKGYELVNLEGVNIPKEAIDAVPAQIATTNKVLPISFDKATKRLTVVM